METGLLPGIPVACVRLLDLPIRDGNILRKERVPDGMGAFRPSYQGWKLVFGYGRVYQRDAFRPSYQGWKPTGTTGQVLTDFSF